MGQNTKGELNIAVTFRHTEPTDAIKRHAEEKLAHALTKYIHHESDVRIILSVEKRNHSAEIILKSKNHDLTVKATTEDLYSAIDRVVEIATTQLRKQKERITDHKVQAEAR